MKQKKSLKDTILWLGVALLLAAALFVTYYYNVSSPIKVIIWMAWFIFTAALSFFTVKGQQAFAFAKEAKIELQKVFWPTRQETIQTTSIVMIMVAITGFVLWMIDTVMIWVIAKITHMG